MTYQYQHLNEDEGFHKALVVCGNFEETLREAIYCRKVIIKHLQDLKKEVEESYDKHKKATIGGTVATVTGSTLGIVGFAAGFFTFGLGFGLAAAGGVIAAGGGLTLAGSQIGYHIVSSTTYKNAQKACESDREQAANIEKYGNELDGHLESLANKYRMSKENIFEQLMSRGKLATNVLKYTYSAGRGFDVVGDVARLVKTGASGARTTFTGLSTAAKAFRIGGVVMDVIFIPIDIGVMAKAAYDVHQYRTTGESNSDIAERIGSMIKMLSENLQQMISFLNVLETAH